MPCTCNPLQQGRIPAPGTVLPGLPEVSGVEGWALRNKNLQTPTGPEGSIGTQASLCAAEIPGWSWLL